MHRPELPVPKRARTDAGSLAGAGPVLDYAGVCARFASLQPGQCQPQDQAPVLVRAQVCRKRSLSARLAFVDLRFGVELSDATASAAGGTAAGSVLPVSAKAL